MKKINLIIIAIALVLGMGQCKKKDLPETPETPTPEVEGDQVYISVSVNGGSKHIVYPESGVYFFETGDKLYVAEAAPETRSSKAPRPHTVGRERRKACRWSARCKAG